MYVAKKLKYPYLSVFFQKMNIFWGVMIQRILLGANAN